MKMFREEYMMKMITITITMTIAITIAMTKDYRADICWVPHNDISIASLKTVSV